VFWEARVYVDLQQAAASDVSPTVMSTLVDAERFPALRQALDAGIFEGPDDREGDFAFGLARVLDGVERLIAER
jgi:hypothetical protein